MCCEAPLRLCVQNVISFSELLSFEVQLKQLQCFSSFQAKIFKFAFRICFVNVRSSEEFQLVKA